MARKFIPENFYFKRKDAKTQSFILNTESTKDTKKNYQKLEKWSLRSLDGTKIIHDGQKIYSRKLNLTWIR